MIDLSRTCEASPLLHAAPGAPEGIWSSEGVAIDAPPDNDIAPEPDAVWRPEAVRSGLCGAVAPRVVALPDGGYRLYYTQLLPRTGFPDGANDYDNSTARILSAFSSDGAAWTPEPGVRLTPQQGGAGEFRVVSGDVVPCLESGGRLRMYYECCDGPQSRQNSIRSAVSADGLQWTVEPGTRFALSNRNLSSPRIALLDDGRCRLYCGVHGAGIISAVSSDGLAFEQEPGWRITADNRYDHCAAFAPEIMRPAGGKYLMYYADYGTPQRADILSADSADGLSWTRSPQSVLSPSNEWDAAKCSEMCVIWNPAAQSGEPFRMLYEACDGSTPARRGVWRIISAVCSRNN